MRRRYVAPYPDEEMHRRNRSRWSDSDLGRGPKASLLAYKLLIHVLSASQLLQLYGCSWTLIISARCPPPADLNTVQVNSAKIPANDAAKLFIHDLSITTPPDRPPSPLQSMTAVSTPR